MQIYDKIANDVLTDLGQPFGIIKSDKVEKKINEILRQEVNTYLLYKIFNYPMYLLPYVY